MSAGINPLVDFLATYGPGSSSSNMFDEFVRTASKDTGCQPLEIDQPLIGDIVDRLRSGEPRSFILTGTAGDGKTYTARKVFEDLTGDKKFWGNNDKIKHLRIGCRNVKFIKDLSELNEEDKNRIFPEVVNALRGIVGADLFVICVNDGHLLKFFRDRNDFEDGRELHNDIREMLRQESSEDIRGNFRLINMSRQTHDTIVDQVLDQIVEHPSWDGCQGCAALQDHTGCPIRINREIMRDRATAALRTRIKAMVRIAAANGRHLSIRQVILLSVNILLGDQKPGGSGLLTCNKARKRMKEEDGYRLTNPFSNTFGTNLPVRQRAQYGVFSVLEDFGVGRETNNYFDEQLLSERSGIPDHPVYGSGIFADVRRHYTRDPVVNAAEMRDALAEQRRLVFLLSNGGEGWPRRKDPWNLSVYKHGGSYNQSLDALLKEEDLAPRVVESVVRGLNRVMTGLMTSTGSDLWITRPSGIFRGQEIPLLVETIPATPKKIGFGLKFYQRFRTILSMRVEFNYREENTHIAQLDMSPILFEFLIRVANGALPASFGGECLQDIKKFQLQAGRKLEEFGSDLREIEPLSATGELVSTEIRF